MKKTFDPRVVSQGRSYIMKINN